MPDQFAAAFLVTRPIQYLNVINIPCADTKCTLLVVDSFKGAQALKEEAEMPGSRWAAVWIFDSVQCALAWVRKHKEAFTDFFTFSDFGLRLCMTLGRLKPLRIHVYEEGAGTYVRDTFWPGSIRFFASLLSSGKFKLFRHMGDCRFVDTIFVNHVELYKLLFPECRKTVLGFSMPLLEHLTENSSDPGIVRLLPLDAANRDALLYLSDWTVNKEIFDVLAAHPSHVSIAKFHPAYLGADTLYDEFDLVVDTAILAEIAIAELAKSFRSLTVVHECSSAVLNCRLAGIVFEEINIGSSEIGIDVKFCVVRNAVEKVLANASEFTESEKISVKNI